MGWEWARAQALVGGATAAERNVIAANGGTGVWLASDDSTVAGNIIGTAADGETPLGNGDQGVYIGAAHNGVQGNRIAYTSRGGPGVQVDPYPANTLRRNAIWGNEGAGILLVAGGNQMLPAPVIFAATRSGISGMACAVCTVEVFSDGEDEGRVYEGSAVADASGYFKVDKDSPLAGPFMTATATATDAQGNTSQFSVPVAPAERAYLPLVLRSR